ncbi:MAG: flagellar biosynthetic protein FliO [Tepidisphaeraceae bacterium]
MIVVPLSLVAIATTGPAGLPDFGEQLVRMLVTLGVFIVVLLALPAVLPRWLRSRGPSKGGGLIDVVEVRQLEPGKRLHLVKIAGKPMLLATSGDRVTYLAGAPLNAADLDTAAAASTRSPSNGGPAA